VSRDIGTTNETTVAGASVHIVTLAKLEFDTPVYVHTGYGTITYDSNDYLGVGQFGSVSNAKESEVLSPNSINLSLSGVDANFLTEALDSATYGDKVTLYEGYRQDDGTLVEDPWVLWSGTLEYATVQQGEENSINLVCQHDLATLEEKDNSRFTDEDQDKRYDGDRMFEYITKMANVRLNWGGFGVVNFSDSGTRRRSNRGPKT